MNAFASMTSGFRTHAFVAAAIFFVQATWPGQAFAADETTHLNVPTGRLIHLKPRFAASGHCVQSDSQFDMVRVKATGDLADEPFVVPAGKQLIVTDITWYGRPRANATFVPGRSLLARVLVYPSSAPTSLREVHRTPPVMVTSETASSLLGSSQSLTSGLRIAAKNGVCLSVINVGVSITSFHRVTSATVLGYLVKFP